MDCRLTQPYFGKAQSSSDFPFFHGQFTNVVENAKKEAKINLNLHAFQTESIYHAGHTGESHSMQKYKYILYNRKK